ncbi:HNH endonuclease [Chitinophaga sp. Cy-1792]|uniref:HNH endonuclease n=1 Tax=Chitinophaga sp. Cy-1792 TaxID=2608339 RepID=UPI00141DB388|nr:HNH endonuclease [Chitinophaga sp. Cy-1792]NIG54561.1 hypothetical protein [Chitinophaga sp. Cy-1792]
MDLVRSVLDIVENVNHFKNDIQSVRNKKSLFYFRVYKYFGDWYYFPNEEIFIPSKFLGYKNNRITNYAGSGHGGITKKILFNYFEEVPKGTSRFNELLEQLITFSEKLGCHVGQKVSGKGGIYLEKHPYLITNQLSINDRLLKICENDIASYKEEENYSSFEGAVSQQLVNKYERDPKLRAAAIKYHGVICKVCNFDFQKYYGNHGKDYIEVHHLKPLHQLNGQKKIDPKIDMTVLCANCHRMIHRDTQNSLSLTELEAMVLHKHSY